jgi:hypothetical protein
MLAGGTAIGVFALCCAERLSVVAERLADSPLIGRTVRAGLDLGWSVGAGQYPSPEALSASISDLDTFIGLESNLGKFHRYLNDTVIAVAYALEAVQGGDSTAALNVAGAAREIYFKLSEDIWPKLSRTAQAAAPIMRGEVSRQVRDAQAIASWGGVMSPDRLAGLRLTAHAEGETLVELILGRKKDPEKDPAPDQQPLF